MDTLKRISVDQLTPGMFVVKLDRPWLKTPFLFHKRMIKESEEIALLKRHGIREVVIDLAKSEAHAPAHASEGGQGGRSHLSEEPFGSCTQTTPDPLSTAEPVRLPTASQMRAARQVYTDAQAVMDRLFDDADSGIAPAVSLLSGVVTGLLTRILDDRTSMLMHLYLCQMRRYDQTLSSHAIDVCALSLLFAVESGLTPEDQETLGIGALLHDLGYLRLPRNLFRKGIRCTEQERTLLNRHPSLGAAILAGAKDLRDGARRVITEHHERRDGSGFPLGLAGSQISPLSQLVGVADTYLSLIAPRDGRAPLILNEAIKRLFILGRKGEFAMELVEVAVKSLGVYPIGSLVELNTGQRGVVVALNPLQRLRPVLALVSDPPSDAGREPRLLDLSATHASGPSPSIARCLDPQQHGIDVAMYLEACQNHAES
jgi:HD-GYP domain-containing protein (c-di-GMP phosphodiesterase class II)